MLETARNNPDAVNQVYNVAVENRTSLNELYREIQKQLLPRYPHLADAKPTHRDFRPGDVRHSLADISKAADLLAYTPTHRLREGLIEVVDWYIQNA